MSTLKVNAITDASGGNTATINSMTPTADSLQGFRNRIINGDMRIDQRNAGAAVTVSSSGNVFSVDRFLGNGTAASGVFTIQQSSTAPTGFINSAGITVTTNSVPGSSDFYLFSQKIEGTNIADLAWGTANAKTVTLSFWVRSSLTGTFGGAIKNSAVNRTYPFSYTIDSANTWEQKSITIAGDTTGTWLTTTGIGMYSSFSLGSGSSRLGTANTWAAANYDGPTGQTNIISTLNATWYITGVQLEVGSVATPFERRDYGRELIMCQRYYYRTTPGVSFGIFGSSWNESTTRATGQVKFPVTMRTRPTALEQTGTAANYAILHGATSTNCSAVPSYEAYTNAETGVCFFTVASGLTAGQGSALASASGATTAYLGWSAEL